MFGAFAFCEHYNLYFLSTSQCQVANVPQTELSVGVLAVLVIRGLGPKLGKLLNSADNFCAQARYLVHVAFATLR